MMLAIGREPIPPVGSTLADVMSLTQPPEAQ